MNKKDVYELTNPQKSIWNTELFCGDTTVNNICVSGILYEEVDIKLVKKAINNVVEQNDAFRIRITNENNKVKQYISDFKSFDIEVKYIENEEQIKIIEKNEAKYKFNMIDSDLYKFKIAISEQFTALILTAHHIIADSWSMGLVIKEILRNYNCLKNNVEVEEKRFSYVDYINSEEFYKLSKKNEDDKKYWKETFKTIPETATIPTLKDNIKEISYNAKRLSYTVNKETVFEITKFCKKNNISVFNFFMALISLYVGRVSNLEDFVIGTPILNRSNFKDKHTMGMFVNTVPVRINIENDIEFKEFVHKLSVDMMQVLRHQKYSYNSILTDLRKRGENIPNLYNIIYSYQITKAVNEQYGKYTTNWTFNNYCANDFNIHVSDVNDTGKLVINYDYLVDKYSSKDVKNINDRIMFMIEQILENDMIKIKDIEIITKAEEKQILEEFNNTKTKYSYNKNIVELFEKQVIETPNKVAIVFKDQRLTYKELNEKANSLANYLKDEKIDIEDTIAIFLDKSIEMIIAMLAILKVGANYLPIDVNYPKSRIDYMLEDSKAKIILSSKKQDFSLIKNNVEIIDITLDNELYKKMSTENLKIKIKCNNLAYMMYTSGSTGKPKGVMVEHKNIVRLVKEPNYIQFDLEDRILQTGSIVFDACTFEIWGALLNGLELYIITKEELLSSYSLKKFIEKNQITILWLTSPLFNKLCEDDPTIFEHIKYLLTGGDVLSPKHINKALKYNDKLKIINGYGPTENTTFSCCFQINKEYKSSIPIGRPISNSTCYVVSKNGRLQPIGVPGELWVGGAGVSRGYLNREELTAEKFINNYYNNDRIYKTGDLVKWTADGNIEFLGRMDNQVKIRGFRIELNEINLKILNFQEIKQSYTTIYTINDEKYICSYVVFKEKDNTKELKEFLRKNLPSYMIPTFIVVLDKIPLNINGKVERNALPEPTQISKEIVQARDSIDGFLIDTLEKMLKTSNISIEETFIDLGGDSLNAITLSTMIYKKYNVQITVKEILNNMTIMEISDFIKNSDDILNKMTIINKAEDKDTYNLSSAQKRIYYTSKMIGENNLVYNVPGAILINKILDKAKVEKCFKKIIEKQSSFRTAFVLYNDDVKQVIREKVKFDIPSFESKSSNIKNIINEFPKPFDLEEAPLLRVELHYLDNGKTLLLLDSHHIIMDGTSLKILINDFCKLYSGENIERLEIEYKDFATWEVDYIDSDNIKESENYWINKFKDQEIPSINLPYDFNMPSVRSYQGNTISKKITKKDFDKYLAYAKELGVSPYMFFISAFFVLLYKYTGQEEIILGTPTAGRDNYQLKNIIGMFVNNLVVDAKINSDDKFIEFLNKIKSEVLEDLQHQNYPYDLLIKKLDLPTDNSRNPLFDVMFTYQNTGENKVVLDGETAEFLNPKSDISKFNLSLEINPNTRVVNLEYRIDLFKEDTIERLFDHYINTLNNIIANRDIIIKDIEIISQTERDIIINKFNDTKTEYPRDKTLPELFENIVKKYPNNIAVSHEESSLTYKELDEKSNYLADELLSIGIKKGDTVGVCLNKSLELLVSIWAILKVGAVYMPMYIDYPEDRLKYMLENSEAKLLIASDKIINKIDYNGSKKVINSVNDILAKDKLKSVDKITSDDVAYIIYTSGSTGKPKGVQIAARNLINFIYSFKEYYDNDITDKDVFLSSTNISFDVSIFEIFLPILNGATLVLYTEEIIRDIITYCNCIINKNITTLYIPPNILNEVYNILKDSTNIKINKMLVGVEAITKNTLNKYLKLNPDMKIINGYGPTETTICCSALKYEMDESNDDIVSIGVPLHNNQIYILDKDKNIQPIGIIGELYVTGDGVGKGYINNQTETNKNYVDNIFNDNSNKMYRTGDLAKWNPDGTINFIGRNDSQVKISGHRIELKEVNYVIMQYPNITKAYTTINKKGNSTYIISYFVAESDIKTKDLLTFLKSKLANYMIPNFITQLESFPLTLNGKIDKTKLPISTVIKNKQYVAPRDNFEKQVINIWKKLFLLDKIGIDDNFFDIGGDSLTAIKFQIEAMNLGLNISYSDIFSYPTPRELSERKIDVNKIDYDNSKNYDYTNINNLVANNNIENLYKTKENSKKHEMGNILLVGSTGFLGAHILDNYLTTQKGKVYCLIRKKSLLEPEERLRKTLNFYFDDKYDSEFGNRIIVVNGDIVDSKFTLSEENYEKLAENVDTIIHSAALVKHYGSFEQFNDINVVGTKNIIKFCKKFNKKIYYISTLSISGSGLSETTSSRKIFREDNFYIGQNLNNVYIYTKFEAERLIYEEILNGLAGCVLRIGNITNRYSDGKFQINTSENAFVNRIKSILKLGVIQNKFLEHAVEFTPVDICADAIIKIIDSDPQFTTFHIYNNNFIRFDTLLANLNSLDINLKPVTDEEFAKTVNKFLNSENLRNEISGIVTDLDKNKLLNLINNILPNSDFTQAYLELLGFKWPQIDIEYLKKYIKYFNSIKYIE